MTNSVSTDLVLTNFAFMDSIFTDSVSLKSKFGFRNSSSETLDITESVIVDSVFTESELVDSAFSGHAFSNLPKFGLRGLRHRGIGDCGLGLHGIGLRSSFVLPLWESSFVKPNYLSFQLTTTRTQRNECYFPDVFFNFKNTLEAASCDYFGPTKSDNISRMITITDEFYLVKWSKRTFWNVITH